MAVTADILRSYHSPRAVIRDQLRAGRREERALMFLMLACGLIFVAQWPTLSRQAQLDPAVPLDARLGGALLAWGFIAPLALYVLAAVSHLVARVLGGHGDGYGSRLALFWSLLAAAPLWLLNGLVGGLAGSGPAAAVTGAIALAAFVMLWGLSLYEAEWGTT